MAPVGTCCSGFLHQNVYLYGRNQEAWRAWIRTGIELANLQRPMSSDLLPTVRPPLLRGPPRSPKLASTAFKSEACTAHFRIKSQSNEIRTPEVQEELKKT